MNKARVDMSLYNNIASSAGAADGLPTAAQMPAGVPLPRAARTVPRPDMALYEGVTGQKIIHKEDNGNIKTVLNQAATALSDTSWSDNEKIRKVGPQVADLLKMIISEL